MLYRIGPQVSDSDSLNQDPDPDTSVNPDPVSRSRLLLNSEPVVIRIRARVFMKKLILDPKQSIYVLDINAPGEASSPTENSSNTKFLHFLFLGTLLACLDPDS